MRLEELRSRLENVRELTEEQWEILNRLFANKPIPSEDASSDDVQAIDGLFDDLVDFSDLDADDVEGARERLEKLRNSVEEADLESLDDDDEDEDADKPAEAGSES